MERYLGVTVLVLLGLGVLGLAGWLRRGATPPARRWMDARRIPATSMVRGYVVAGLPLTGIALLAFAVVLGDVPFGVRVAALAAFVVVAFPMSWIRFWGASYRLYPAWARAMLDAEIAAGVHTGFTRRRRELAEREMAERLRRPGPPADLPVMIGWRGPMADERVP